MDGQSRSPDDVTRILHEWKDGNREALDRLIPIVYEELRTIASRQLAREWRHDRLQTTTVVNEAYVKLFAQREVDWQNRGHFFAIAAQLMRRILVDHARRELREKHAWHEHHNDTTGRKGPEWLCSNPNRRRDRTAQMERSRGREHVHAGRSGCQ